MDKGKKVRGKSESLKVNLKESTPPPQEYSGREDFEEGTGKTDSVRSPGAKWKVGEASVVE